MSEKIDWSNAPEWAMVLLKHVLDNRYAWAVSHAEESDAWRVERTGFGFRLMKDCWRVVSTRPTTTSWSGEGLPPVGVVLEVNPDKAGWRKSVISYVGDGFIAWMQVGDLIVPEYGAFIDDCEFRPIRTPEQIAAGEREAAIKEMTANYAKNSDTLAGWAAYVYDTLGYRKP